MYSGISQNTGKSPKKGSSSGHLTPCRSTLRGKKTKSMNLWVDLTWGNIRYKMKSLASRFDSFQRCGGYTVLALLVFLIFGFGDHWQMFWTPLTNILGLPMQERVGTFYLCLFFGLLVVASEHFAGHEQFIHVNEAISIGIKHIETISQLIFTPLFLAEKSQHNLWPF